MREFIINNVIPVLPTGLGLVIASLVAVYQAIKKGKVKKFDVLYDKMIDEMENAEKMYQPIKEKGIDVSVMKKQSVLNALQIFANANKIEFDSDTWNEELEKMIAFSKTINAEKIKKVVL